MHYGIVLSIKFFYFERAACLRLHCLEGRSDFILLTFISFKMLHQHNDYVYVVWFFADDFFLLQTWRMSNRSSCCLLRSPDSEGFEVTVLWCPDTHVLSYTWHQSSSKFKVLIQTGELFRWVFVMCTCTRDSCNTDDCNMFRMFWTLVKCLFPHNEVFTNWYTGWYLK